MAKAEFIDPQPRIPSVRLELTGEEAETVLAVLGIVSGPLEEVSRVYGALAALFPAPRRRVYVQHRNDTNMWIDWR